MPLKITANTSIANEKYIIIAQYTIWHDGCYVKSLFIMRSTVLKKFIS